MTSVDKRSGVNYEITKKWFKINELEKICVDFSNSSIAFRDNFQQFESVIVAKSGIIENLASFRNAEVNFLYFTDLQPILRVIEQMNIRVEKSSFKNSAKQSEILKNDSCYTAGAKKDKNNENQDLERVTHKS